MEPCQCKDNCECKKSVIAKDIKDFLDQLFHNEPIKDQCYQRIVDKGGFKNIQELEDANVSIT